MVPGAVISGIDIALPYAFVTCAMHTWIPHYMNLCFRFCNENFKIKVVAKEKNHGILLDYPEMIFLFLVIKYDARRGMPELTLGSSSNEFTVDFLEFSVSMLQ